MTLRHSSLNKPLAALFILIGIYLQAQEPSLSRLNNIYFSVKGLVRNEQTYRPVDNARIELNGKFYSRTDSDGSFRIKAAVGDLLTIKQNDYKNIYYTIKSDERLLVELEPLEEESKYYQEPESEIGFKQFIDSAENYKELQAERSIEFISKALKKSKTQKENAEAFEVLGDVYIQWNQLDLAVNNYKISLQNRIDVYIQLKLSRAYYLNNQLELSLETLESIDDNKLNHWGKIEWNEGYGDVYYSRKKYQSAIENYGEALKIARQNELLLKVADLNSKIAMVYNSMGEQSVATNYLGEALTAVQDNKTKSLEIKNQFAEIDNSNKKYKHEIDLRKEIVEEAKEIVADSIISNDSPLTLQKQNYKIGNAYLMDRDYDNAITFFNKSISEAEQKDDLIVMKDALRKKAEILETKGEFSKAKEALEEYVRTVDEIYIKKEQEIVQASRLERLMESNQMRISSLENERALSKSRYDLSVERNKRQQLIIYSLAGGILLLLTSGFFIYKYINQQRLANNLLALKSLRSQMNPHFIFNALNSVNGFIATSDELNANKYLNEFSTLMRAVLENSEQDFIPMKKELELVKTYTKLEHFRFRDKFDYNISISPKLDLSKFEIPPMLVQPYIENAVWHGLRYLDTKGNLWIDFAPSDNRDELIITITDNGIGREKSKSLKTQYQKKSRSTAMRNIQKRVEILNRMYKDKITIEVMDAFNEGNLGTKVRITLKPKLV